MTDAVLEGLVDGLPIGVAIGFAMGALVWPFFSKKPDTVAVWGAIGGVVGLLLMAVINYQVVSAALGGASSSLGSEAGVLSFGVNPDSLVEVGALLLLGFVGGGLLGMLLREPGKLILGGVSGLFVGAVSGGLVGAGLVFFNASFTPLLQYIITGAIVLLITVPVAMQFAGDQKY